FAAAHDEGAVARLLTPIAKLRVSRRGVEMASQAVEAHGGNGYIENWPVARRSMPYDLGGHRERHLPRYPARVPRRAGAAGGVLRVGGAHASNQRNARSGAREHRARP